MIGSDKLTDQNYNSMYAVEMPIYRGVFEDESGTWRESGTLNVSNDSGNELILLPKTSMRPGGASEEGSTHLRLHPTVERIWIHGELSNGQHVTLPSASMRERAFGSSANWIGQVTFSCPQVLIGNMSYASRPAEFDGVQLQFKYLQRWLEDATASVQFDEFGKSSIIISDIPASVLTIEQESMSFELIISQKTYIQRKLGELFTTQETSLHIFPCEKRDMAWFSEQQRQIWMLISIISGFESETLKWEGIVLFSKSLEMDEIPQPYDSFNIINPETIPQIQIKRIHSLLNQNILHHTAELFQRQSVFSAAESGTEQLLTQQNRSPSFLDLVRNWYSLPSGMQQIAGLLLASTRQDDYYIESRLQNLCQALEAMHRELYPDQTAALPKTEFKEVSAWFKDNVPEHLSPEVRKMLVARFGNLNMVSFNTRITALLTPYWEEYLSTRVDCNNVEELVKRIGQVRNNLAHANAGSTNGISEQRELRNIMTQILQMIFLEKLGWSRQVSIQLVGKFSRSSHNT